jgi:hypothetical protein
MWTVDQGKTGPASVGKGAFGYKADKGRSHSRINGISAPAQHLGTRGSGLGTARSDDPLQISLVHTPPLNTTSWVRL